MKFETLNLLTAGAASVGYVAGLAFDKIAVDNVAKKNKSLNEYMGLTAESTEQIKITLWSRIGKTALAPLALAGAVAAGVNTYAWVPENQATIDQPATVVMVVDRSGATALSIDGKPVSDQIDSVVKSISDIDGINTEAVVANTGTQQFMNPDKALASKPFGEANMAKATSLALNRTAQVVPIANGVDTTRNTAVVVITNGNSIGKVESVLANSKAGNGINEPTPVFVVDVQGNKAEQTTEDLQKIASQTGAEYWGASSDDLDQVVNNVKDAVVSIETTQEASISKWPLKFLGLTALAYLIITFKRRKDMPFGQGIKGE